MIQESHTQNLLRPSIIQLFPKGEGRVLRAGELTLTHLVYQPTWRWSTNNPDMIGARWCQHTHHGFVLSGRMIVEFEDGPDLQLHPGDAYAWRPGHDPWVVGDEPCVLLEISARRFTDRGPSAT